MKNIILLLILLGGLYFAHTLYSEHKDQLFGNAPSSDQDEVGEASQSSSPTSPSSTAEKKPSSEQAKTFQAPQSSSAQKALEEPLRKGFITVQKLAEIYSKYPEQTAEALKGRLFRLKGPVTQVDVKSPEIVEFQMPSGSTPFATISFSLDSAGELKTATAGRKGKWEKDGRKLLYTCKPAGQDSPVGIPQLVLTEGEEASFRVALVEATPEGMKFDYEPQASDKITTAIKKYRFTAPTPKPSNSLEQIIKRGGLVQVQDFLKFYAENPTKTVEIIQGQTFSLQAQVGQISIRPSMEFVSLATATLANTTPKIVIERGVGKGGMMSSEPTSESYEKVGKDLFYILKHKSSSKSSSNVREQVLTEGEVSTFRVILKKNTPTELIFTSHPSSPNAIGF